jgi:hypothetical protein
MAQLKRSLLCKPSVWQNLKSVVSGGYRFPSYTHAFYDKWDGSYPPIEEHGLIGNMHTMALYVQPSLAPTSLNSSLALVLEGDDRRDDRLVLLPTFRQSVGVCITARHR